MLKNERLSERYNMKKRLQQLLFILFLFTSSLTYAEEKHLYLKGESDGIEIRIKLLDKYSFKEFYSDFSSREQFNTFLEKCITNKTLEKHTMIIATNDFPVEVKNNSDKAITFSKQNDRLKVFVDSHGTSVELMRYQKKDSVTNDYPRYTVLPNKNVSFLIDSRYPYDDFYRDFKEYVYDFDSDLNRRFTHLVNICASDFDYVSFYYFQKGVSIKAINASLSDSYFYAVYYLAQENKEIYLYLTYE